ncbi:MAG: multifunctional CCA addition/repair protein [Xanthomonadales bacterium]|nr:multifunctional CCA addition/repair protein [Gammaproteobacteria bacterium]MBT8052847.1 multifunctional CCA addition/repair protein [Gammaproteobacteria bacterium]NND55692.1 multifunctional CCA addition/repair protein [Xanthomonadales bacterium]NNK50003.1 multifunctional CCA addition/repair protein [Xanthomonadales bacterium]
MTGAVYLVGGAVRDELLGILPGERDWVVVGGTPDELLARDFRQVGASFPVFLHPETGEEYALARTERKQGHGYHGFNVDFHPGVTLEQDLERRDLTINAMAKDQSGKLIDPYGGQRDLEQKILRHVSPAFCEDPLRVLRVARFAARFAEAGFRVHESTMTLMREMAASGELEHLVPERVWTEFTKALSTSQPGRFVEVLRASGALASLLPEVDCLFGIPQPEQYHPEIDTGIHVIMTMNRAAQLGGSAAVVFSLLVHDLGKGLTEAELLPAHHGHETAGVPLVDRVCERLRVPVAYRDLALKVCALHLRCHRLLEARPVTLLKLIEDADLLRRPERAGDFILACKADYQGRKGLEQRPYPQQEVLLAALHAALGVRGRDIRTEGLSGVQIGAELRKARIEAIAGIEGPAERIP